MNREILFRGKRIDNGEWVEGAFLNDRDGAFYICPAVSDITYGDNGNRRRIGCWYKVDPATVGQFSGLVDKNKKRIFDGDVVRMEFFDTEEIGEIVWDEERCKFAYDSPDGDRYGVDGTIEVEVLGNIHDGPSLLQG